MKMSSFSNPDLDLETASGFSDDFQSPQIESEYPMYGMGVYKIGAGDTSTIWLARDSSSWSWVALRILMAEQSSSIEENITCYHDILAHHDQDEGDPRFIKYKRHFHIDGPNGRHLCLVLPFCGPNLHSLSNYMNSRMKPQFVQALAYQATEILRDLYARGICHGNIRPGNLLLRIRNLDHLGDQGIYRLFGQPKIEE
ncbi:Protein kinase dsk1 [Fusarium oxysporum f. sp. cubense race 1]|uniref:non-specific serine/threonine protein kinase n=1 Tax=Fusarium oxysporum f. sp. cubense (strain race 1) TaxID=1229664 RepID=N4TR71_FUSC1|nr:Protein kinase dsk1 [Fusarium oxysporum f. sp. cubense race 1]